MNKPSSSPNILLLLVDQLRYPRFSYHQQGLANPIKDILSFVNELDEDNPYLPHFPGFVKLREYATVLTNHSIAESACIPSRASIMTGQYGPRTGVTQTDGLFKSGDAQNFPWLKADGFATMGDWFREAGYTTHYFGKWHTSNPPEHTLQGFGFDDWELSWPEPHGSLINNLGTYRDYQFTDLACSFLQARGLGVPFNRASAQQAQQHPKDPESPHTQPFFAVCSFTNPHDIAAYPTLPRMLVPKNPDIKNPKDDPNRYGPGDSVPVPAKGTLSTQPTEGTYRVNLNPTGLPQDNATASPTQNEDLLNNNKPDCQFDYSVKIGLGLAAKAGLGVAKGLAANDPNGMNDNQLLAAAVKATMGVAIPFQNQDDPEGAATGFLQYYAYMIAMVDRHILRVLEALESSGLRENTVLVFASDHGEYGAAHAKMMEKWHAAYQEVLHVPVLISSPSINPSKGHPERVDGLTSHIDLLPTLMGLANIDETRQSEIAQSLSKTHYVAPFPGIDLSPMIQHPKKSAETLADRSLLFVTDDMITEPLPRDNDPHNQESWEQYKVYAASLAELKKQAEFKALCDGPVTQPAHVRAVRQGEWKLVRYCDPWSQ
ncbi:sulfatase-like hydrolase/transferase [Marinicella sediminis]|uniref:Sulfatase-like hydrolase/transferase n=1 Tax=Marinicella sediminis TaxID=1792834 RepID=A0ABV7JA49_9GAMM|nr:sulfatase-like hydrolase/transferase [Marinicella sediminis]